MPPRGNSEGLDFSHIMTHYLFLFTTALSVIAWFIAFIAQAIATAAHGNGPIGVLWFAIFLQLFLILGVVYTLASNSLAMHRYQISTFGSVAIVFAVIGVNQTIFTGVGSLDAVAAGWLILAIVDILWVLYFTSEEDSLALHIFNSMGTGGLAPPSRRRRTMVRTEPPMHNMAGNGGYANNYASGGGISSHDPKAMGGPIGSPGVRSQNSFNGGQSLDQGAPRSIGNAGAGSIGAAGGETRSIGGGAGSAGGADMGPASPLMGGAAGLGAGSGGPGSAELGQVPDSYSYTAKALYAYTASPDDPNEISFTKGEVLDIVDKQGKWWQAKKADGTIGIAPSNYLQII